MGRWLVVTMGLVGLITAVLPNARAEITYRFNGLSTSDVRTALGAPDSCKKYTTFSEEVWYYGSITIRFKNGRVSECDIPNVRSSLTTTSRLSSTSYGITSSPSLGVSALNTSARSTTSTYTKSSPSWSINPITPSIGGIAGSLQKSTTTMQVRTDQRTYLGKLSNNPYDPESISNPYGKYGSPYANNLMNSYSKYGSPYSTTSWKNPYATNPPKIYAADGTYLGKLSSNIYDPESISNPYGRYGNPYGNNLMNPYSRYGSPYSSLSWRNPYATNAPRIYSESK